MINVNKATEEDALHMAHLAQRLQLADRLISGLSKAGIDFAQLETDAAKAAKAWYAELCTNVAAVLSPAPKKVLSPETKLVSQKSKAKKPTVKAVKKSKVKPKKK